MNGKEILLLFPFLIAFTYAKLTYPQARREDFIVDDYFGTQVVDPYRWMEELAAPEVRDFVDKQNNLTEAYLKESDKTREELGRRIYDVQNSPRYALPEKRGNRYFFYVDSYDGRQVHVQDGKDTTSRLLLDPTHFTSRPNYNGVSRDGQLMVYQLYSQKASAKRDSPKQNLYIRNITTNEDYSEVLSVIGVPKLTWTPDSKGFFYVRHTSESEDDPNTNKYSNKVYYHRLGTSQKQDSVVFDFTDFPYGPNCQMQVSDDGRYFVVTPYGIPIEERDISFFVGDLIPGENGGIEPEINLQPVFARANFTRFEYVTNDEQQFYFNTDAGAPLCQIVSFNLNNPHKPNWKTIVAEHKENYVDTVNAVDINKVIIRYANPGKPGAGLGGVELRYINNGTLVKEFPLEDGEHLTLSGNKFDSEVIFRTRRLVAFPEVYTLDLSKPTSEIQKFKITKVESYDPTKFTVTRTTYVGFNNTSRPLFLLHSIDHKKNKNTPCFLVDHDFFDPVGVYFTYLRGFNGIIAVPYLGDQRLAYANSSLVDFIAAADYLVANNFTSPSKLILRRPGPGGMYAAAAVNRRPDLFAAFVPEFADFDMLRYQKFSRQPFWIPEYGTAEEKDKFPNLYDVSPLHNIRVPGKETVQYPAVLVTLARDRWYPAQHSFKYIAELQHTIGSTARQTNPLLMRVGGDSHPNNPRRIQNLVDKEVDVFTFLLRVLGVQLQ